MYRGRDAQLGVQLELLFLLSARLTFKYVCLIYAGMQRGRNNANDSDNQAQVEVQDKLNAGIDLKQGKWK